MTEKPQTLRRRRHPHRPARRPGQGHRRGQVRRRHADGGHAGGEGAPQPVPPCVARSIDTSAALALPGVLAVLTPDDLGDWHDLRPRHEGHAADRRGTGCRRKRRSSTARRGTSATPSPPWPPSTSTRPSGRSDCCASTGRSSPSSSTPKPPCCPTRPASATSPSTRATWRSTWTTPSPRATSTRRWPPRTWWSEGTFRTPKQEHCTQETAAAMAWVDAAGRLNVWSQCQLAHLARRELAAHLQPPRAQGARTDTVHRRQLRPAGRVDGGAHRRRPGAEDQPPGASGLRPRGELHRPREPHGLRPHRRAKRASTATAR